MSAIQANQVSQIKESNILTSLWFFLQPFKFNLILFFICSLVQVAFLMSLPISYRIIFDDAVQHKNISLLIIISVALLVGFIIRTIADYVALYLITQVGAKITVSMRLQLFTHMESLSPDFYRRMSTNDLFTTFSDHIMSIENALVGAVPPILRALILIFLSFIMIFWQSWIIGLLVLILFVLTTFLSRQFHARRDREIEKFSHCEKDFLFTIREFIGTHLVIRLYSLLNTWLKILTKKINVAAQANQKANYHIYLAPHFFVAGSYVIEMMVILMGALAVIQGTLTVGVIFSLLALIAYILNGADNISQQISPCVRATTSLRSLIHILEEKPSIVYHQNAVPLPPIRKNIIFKNVKLQAANGQSMLENINFTISARESIAIIGPSGAGKSSILKLLMRLYDPSEGEIIFDDQYNLRDVKEDSLRNQMAVVLQESYLFNMSVRENILMGRLDASEEDIIKASQQAGLHDDIMQLPEGYNTLIGELGELLSVGERQQLALARGFVRHPHLLILDEVTSSVDAISESEIKNSLQEYAHKCTIVMATHRLHLSSNFDHIYVINHGRIVEHGTHNELINSNHLYAKLWEKQNSITLTSEQKVANIDIDYLSKIPVLHYCNKEFLSKLTTQFVIESYGPKQTIISQNSLGDKFYLIARGEVEVWRNLSIPDQAELVAQLSEGDYFGEVALLTNEKRNASVIAITPCLVLTLSRHQFNKLLINFPALQAELESIAANRQL